MNSSSKQGKFQGWKAIEHTSVPLCYVHNCMKQTEHAPGASARVKSLRFKNARMYAHACCQSVWGQNFSIQTITRSGYGMSPSCFHCDKYSFVNVAYVHTLNTMLGKNRQVKTYSGFQVNLLTIYLQSPLWHSWCGSQANNRGLGL